MIIVPYVPSKNGIVFTVHWLLLLLLEINYHRIFLRDVIKFLSELRSLITIAK